MVNHEDNKVLIGNDVVPIPRGGRITSIRKLEKRWGWSNTKVKSFLDLLKKEGMIDYQSDTKKTVITVINYSIYQFDKKEKTSPTIPDTPIEGDKKHHENDASTGESNLGSDSDSTSNVAGKSKEKHHENTAKTSREHTNNNVYNDDKYKDIYDYYLSLDLINHRSYSEDMIKGMKKAEKELNLDTEHMKRMLKRHEEKVESTKKNGQYATRKRSLADFFGQRKNKSTSLICSDYLDERYEEQEQKRNRKPFEPEFVYIDED